MVVLALACSSSDDRNTNNSFLPNQVFDTGSTINTNFPQFNSLQFPGNYEEVPGFGLNGIVVYYTGTSYLAWELSDPNHALDSCSKLTLDGIIATCGCSDSNQYDILTGQVQEGTTGQFAMRPYSVEVSGNIIRVFNN